MSIGVFPAYMYHVHAVTLEARRGNHIPKNWSYRSLLAPRWGCEVNPGAPEEQAVLLTIQLSLQPSFKLFMIINDCKQDEEQYKDI